MALKNKVAEERMEESKYDSNGLEGGVEWEWRIKVGPKKDKENQRKKWSSGGNF